MTAWVAPITFSSGTTLTAAQMNAEVRDHAVWLKAALDLITNSTAADSGTATQLRIVRATAAAMVLDSTVTGDAAVRFQLEADGHMNWGPGTGAVDTNLFRSGVGFLKTDNSLIIGTSYYVDATGFVDFTEITAPASPGANTTRLFTQDNGAGKTQLMVKFNTGVAIQIAIQA